VESRHSGSAAPEREKLTKIGAKVVSHSRYVTFQMAEVAVPRQIFGKILSLIAQLRAPRRQRDLQPRAEARDHEGRSAP
jgi:hypothetical protein